MPTEIPAAIQEYLQPFPKDVADRMLQLRETILKAAPDATERIGYGIPTFVLEGNLVHYGGYKHHIGFYPGPSGIKAFEQELSVYEGAKGSIKFPLDQPLPLKLIAKIVAFRVQENLEHARLKKAKKKG